MNTQAHNQNVNHTAMTPRLKDRQTLASVTPRNQNMVTNEFAAPAIPQVENDPIDSVNLPKGDELTKLEKSEQFSSVIKEAFSTQKSMINMRWFGLDRTNEDSILSLDYTKEQTMSPKYQPQFEPIQFDWDY